MRQQWKAVWITFVAISIVWLLTLQFAPLLHPRPVQEAKWDDKLFTLSAMAVISIAVARKIL